MILSLRQIRRRIKSVENTKKMTRAMEMVAAAKLKKLQDLLKQSDFYIAELKRILGTLVKEKPLAHPLLEKREETHKVLAFVIASDTGLCGSYNTNIFDETSRFISSTPHLPPPKMGGGMEGDETLTFISTGKQATNFLKRVKQTTIQEFMVPRPQEIDSSIQKLTELATQAFLSKAADRVVFIYTHVVSLASLKTRVTQLFPFSSTPELPADISKEKNNEGGIVDYIVEPSLTEVLEKLIPEYIEAETGQFLKHSLVAEQVSRMMAMRQATDSAKDMIESLTLMRNKARQASITKELIEVVSGSRALKIK